MKPTLVSVFSLLILFPHFAHAEWFLHRSTETSNPSNSTRLAAHLTPNSGSKIFISPSQSALSDKHNNISYGLWYPSPQWAIFREDRQILPPRFEFSIYVAEAGDTAFTHTHLHSEQTSFRISYIDHPSLNNSPNAFPFLTQNWGTNGVYNPIFVNTIGYDSTAGKWFIDAVNNFDEFTRIPNNARFNILVRTADSNTYRHTVSTDSLTSPLDHPSLNGNPEALLLVAHERQNDDLQDHFTRVQSRYDTSSQRWVLESLRGSDLREDAQYLITLTAATDVPVPTLTINPEPPRNLISIPTEFGQSYQMQAAEDLETWLDEGIAFPGDGTTQIYPTAAVLPSQNYRIVRTPE
ncbi:MAG: DUF7452 domain-containing protein [Roseibacillus sp.]